jgi:hypothetical protein
MGSAEGGGNAGSSNIIRSKPADPGSPSPSHGLVSTLCATENRPWLLIVLGLAVVKESPCCALRLSGTGRRSRRGGGIGRDFSTLYSYCSSEDNGVEKVFWETERVRLEWVSPRSAVDFFIPFSEIKTEMWRLVKNSQSYPALIRKGQAGRFHFPDRYCVSSGLCDDGSQTTGKTQEAARSPRIPP